MWVGAGIAFLVVGFVTAALKWLGDYMSEGVLESDTRGGDLLVALSDDPPVSQALLSGCHSKGALPSSVSAMLASGQLTEIPSGTKMQLEHWSNDAVETMTIAEGMLKGRQVWACQDQVALLHAVS